MVLNVSSMSSVDPLTYGLVTFCKSNNTMLEVSLLTINQVCVCVCALKFPLPHFSNSDKQDLGGWQDR